MTEEQRAAYRDGWAAAGRSSDMDAAESRWLRNNGHTHIEAWADGWTDRATGERSALTKGNTR